jgi:Bacteriophage Mu Gam like protein
MLWQNERSNIMVLSEIDEFEEVEQLAPEEFKVDNDEKAEWAIRKLAKIRRKQAENKAIFEAELQRITKWLETVNTSLENDSRYFEAVLTPYALEERSKGRKSLVLPHGTVKTTAGRPKIEFDSEDNFIEWAKLNDPELLRTKFEINKKILNDLITEDLQVISTQGEIIPNTRVVPPLPSVSFALGEEK